MSFGWMSSEEDVQTIITFLKTCFLDTAGRQDSSRQNPHGQDLGRQNSQRQNPSSTPAASVKDTPTGQSPSGHNSGLQDPSFSLNAHCSTAMPSAADPNHRSQYIVHTEPSIPVKSQGQGHQRHSPSTQSSSNPLQGSVMHDRACMQLAELQTSDTVSTRPSQAEPCTSAQEVAVQRSKRCAWLQQLPWLRCGDEVSAWSAHKSQRLTPPSPTPAGGQPTGQPGGLPPNTSAPPCRQPAQSANLASDSALESVFQSASQSVLHSDFQNGSEAQPCCGRGSLEGIWVYPIKSCGGIRVLEWPLGPNGLLLDREWALVGDDGHVLTQKGLPTLALVQPRVDLWHGFIQVRLAYIGNDAACGLGTLCCRALYRCRMCTQQAALGSCMIQGQKDLQDCVLFCKCMMSCYASLRCAVLCCAVLCCAVLCCAVLRCAALCCAALRCAVGLLHSNLLQSKILPRQGLWKSHVSLQKLL